VKNHPHLEFHETEKSVLFYQFNNKFDVPKAHVKCYIYTDEFNFTRDPEVDLLIALHQSTFKEHFKPVLYLAQMANLQYSFSFGSNQVSLSFSGYNETLIQLVREFFKALRSFRAADYKMLFENERAKMEKNFLNVNKAEPYQISGIYKLSTFQDFGNFTTERQKEALDKISFERFCKFSDTFFSHIRMEFLILGNLTRANALDIVHCAESGFTALRAG
jgi:insulysin